MNECGLQTVISISKERNGLEVTDIHFYKEMKFLSLHR